MKDLEDELKAESSQDGVIKAIIEAKEGGAHRILTKLYYNEGIRIKL